MDIVAINNSNISLLSHFLSLLEKGKETFRYYNKRPVTIIGQHLYTCLIVENEKPIAYGHLDREDGKTWLGIAVIPSEQGKGVANVIMDNLIGIAEEKDVGEIYLSVDKDNFKAVQLYHKYGFVLEQDLGNYLLYKKITHKNKNILYFIPGLAKSHGGVYQYSMGLLNSLKQSPHQIHVLCYDPKTDLIDLINNSSNLSLIPYSSLKRKFLLFLFKMQGFINRAANILFRKRLIIGNRILFSRLLRKYNIDIVHCPTQRLLESKECRTITTIHDVQQFHFPDFFSSMEKAYRSVNYPIYIEKADAIIVSYQHIKDDLVKYCHAAESKINVCLLDMGKLWFQDFSPVGIGKFSESAILYPAATWPHKNHINLIRSLKLLRERGVEIKLICTGNKTPYYETIVSAVNELNMQDLVTFMGIVENETLYELYHQVNAVVVPTLYEAGSFPLMESILMKIPVICSNVTSLPETIGNHDFVFDPKDVEDMADKIYKIVFDKEYISRNGQSALKQAVLLNNNNIIEKMDLIYAGI